ncbi:hypothetical protein ACFFX0_06870 [Citricoccus parietis]|uniref:Uncharacterized protein n=1 Tax=Citricoccus parietis TaxID=592307 RepID=A0ABV5FW63_9MICC
MRRPASTPCCPWPAPEPRTAGGRPSSPWLPAPGGAWTECCPWAGASRPCSSRPGRTHPSHPIGSCQGSLPWNRRAVSGGCP